jgi:hypothetical protein
MMITLRYRNIKLLYTNIDTGAIPSKKQNPLRIKKPVEKNSFILQLLFQDYMFRLPRAIIRLSKEKIQDYLSFRALCDPKRLQ